MSEVKAESKAPKQATYNKNEKSKDVRSTNIQAAKGKTCCNVSNSRLYSNKFGSKRNGQNDQG